MTAVEDKGQSHLLQTISPRIHPTASTISVTQRKGGICNAGSSTECVSAASSTSSLMSRNLATLEQPIQEQYMSTDHRPPLMASNSIQPSSGGGHYVNLCQYSLAPPPVHGQVFPQKNSVSNSTSSLASVSALSESSEIRALFPNVQEHNQQSRATADHNYNQLKLKPGSKISEKTRQNFVPTSSLGDW